MKKTRQHKWLLLPLVSLLAVAMVVGGCSGGTTTTVYETQTVTTTTTTTTVSGGQTVTPTTTTTTVGEEVSLPANLEGTLLESGSTTVQPLAERLAEVFKVIYPDVDVIIQGGGSSQGVKDARDGISDIGAASRELTAEEEGWVTPHVIARDGIAIVVHPSNPVANLTIEQVRDIFSGQITNWSEVGGPNQEIIVISREEGSGTRAAFEEMVMEGELITASAILQPSNGALKTAVSTTPQAVGFLSFGYLEEGVVKALSIEGVAGTVENAKSGEYPIVRPLLFLTQGEPQGLAKAFIDFTLSPVGQAIVEQEGYLSVK